METHDGASSNQRKLKLFGELGLIALAVVLFGYCFISIAQENLTSQESSLFALVLTIASLVVSWLVSRIYNRQSVDASVRNNAVQLGNAISGIKTQLRSLSEWSLHQRSRTVCEDGQTDFVLDHITQMLSAIDCQIDTTLKGIGGSIGDSDRQHTILLGQIGELVEQRMEAVSVASDATTGLAEYKKYEDLISRLDEQIGALAQGLTPSKIVESPSHSPLETIHRPPCPYCDKAQEVSIINRAGQTRWVRCIHCARHFNVHSDGRTVFSRPQSHSDEVQGQLRIREALSPPGFTFSPQEFRFLADAVLSTYVPSQFSLSSLAEELYQGGLLSSISKTRLRRFVQLLHWGKLFTFGPAEAGGGIMDTPGIMTNAISRADIAKAFCRSVGYRMADVVPEQALEGVESDIGAFFAIAAPDLDVSQLPAAYRAGREQALAPSPAVAEVL